VTAAPASRTAVRPSWDTLPAALRDAVARQAGAQVTSAVTQAGGFTPGLAARLAFRGGQRLFVKAVPAGHPVASAYQREADTAARLPVGVPAPALRWTDSTSGWLVLAYDDVDGAHPDLSPAGRDLPAVFQAVAAAHATARGLPDFAEQRASWLHGWAEIVRSGEAGGLGPWAAARVGLLAAAEACWTRQAAGSALVHGDLRADNMLITPAGVYLVDWAHAATGAPWLDFADLGVQLALTGHRPADVEAALAPLPGWQGAPASAITSYLIAETGYWLRSSRLPGPPSVPALRPYQARAAAAGLDWVAWRVEHNLGPFRGAA
jgi:aminoglycoside phosphotransferase (APT) family kinase protein